MIPFDKGIKMKSAILTCSCGFTVTFKVSHGFCIELKCDCQTASVEVVKKDCEQNLAFYVKKWFDFDPDYITLDDATSKKPGLVEWIAKNNVPFTKKEVKSYLLEIKSVTKNRRGLKGCRLRFDHENRTNPEDTKAKTKNVCENIRFSKEPESDEEIDKSDNESDKNDGESDKESDKKSDESDKSDKESDKNDGESDESDQQCAEIEERKEKQNSFFLEIPIVEDFGYGPCQDEIFRRMDIDGKDLMVSNKGMVYTFELGRDGKPEAVFPHIGHFYYHSYRDEFNGQINWRRKTFQEDNITDESRRKGLEIFIKKNGFEFVYPPSSSSESSTSSSSR